jgi:hypothetical protein
VHQPAPQQPGTHEQELRPPVPAVLADLLDRADAGRRAVDPEALTARERLLWNPCLLDHLHDLMLPPPPAPMGVEAVKKR